MPISFLRPLQLILHKLSVGMTSLESVPCGSKEHSAPAWEGCIDRQKTIRSAKYELLTTTESGVHTGRYKSRNVI